MSKLNEVLLKQGRISKAQFDADTIKEDKRKAVKGKDLQKLTKAELIAIIEDLK